MTDDPAHQEAVVRLAARWASDLHGTAHPAITALLHDLAGRVLGARGGTPADAAVLRQVGRDLVDAHLVEPAAFEAVLEGLRAELAGDTAGTALGVLAALSAGCVEAVRRHTRTEQERLAASVLDASVLDASVLDASVLDARAGAERARWTTEARWSAVFSSSPVGIGVARTDGTIIEVNEALCAMFGLSAAEFTGRSMYEFVDAPREGEHLARLRSMASGTLERTRVEKDFVHRSGRVLHTELALSLVRDPHGRPRYLVALVVDLSERRALTERLRHQADHDPLTGLPNRRVFHDRLEAALAAADRDVGVCFLDLDGFQGVNDALGHPVGDELLRRLAHRLATALAGGDDLVARIGGDEFVVLVHGDRGRRLRVADRAIAAVTAPVRIEGRDITISVGVGVVGTDDPGAPRTGTELMQAADTTLRRAKEQARTPGRRAVFDLARHRAQIERSTRSARMADALAAGEFELLHQPIVALADRRLVGVEALVRWRCEGRLLGPDEFVPLAERSGFIVPLGRWVLDRALAQGSAWRRAGTPLLVSVNIAARQVREPGLVDDVARLLAAHDCPAAALQLELTESDAMATAGEPLEVLRALAALGVRLAIDDFGTGYSNLAYLRDLPVHVLKLAGPFVTGRAGGGAGGDRGVAEDETDAAVLGHVVRLAHTLGLTVVAEHVETPAQHARLRELGCDAAQGYLYGPPVPAAEITPPRGAAPDPSRGAALDLPQGAAG